MAGKRLNIKAILADADLRRKLMVSTIQATQAREGIDTSQEQADRAYYVVTETESGAFFDLARFRGRASSAEQREHAFVEALRGENERVRFDVPLRDFSVIESAPLAFMPIKILYPLFRDHPGLYPKFAETRIGHQTFDDDRFVRWWWEVQTHEHGAGNKWPPFAKGGRFSRFYSDVPLVVRWDEDARREYTNRQSNFNVLLTSNSEDYLYRPGLTWPSAASIFNVRRMPEGCIFSHKGPAIFPVQANQLEFLTAVLNSTLALFVCRALSSRGETGGRWEAGIVRRVPVPVIPKKRADAIGSIGAEIEATKHGWDRGNEVATCFQRPWILETQVAGDGSLASRLDRLAKAEEDEGVKLGGLYDSLNDEIFRLYGIDDPTRAVIEDSLGELQPEVLWQQMAGKSVDQKRMEHVWRLLSYGVKRVVEADDDGIVPFSQATGETRLVDRVRQELAAIFPDRDESELELEIVNELRRSTKGYRRCVSLDDWLANAFFEYHVSLYKNRPILWHIASAQGTAPFAFGTLVHYHRFDRNRMAKLRASYVRDTIEELRREAGLAAKAGRAEDRVELQARLEEVQALEKKLQQIQEGHHEGPDGGDRDFRILTPWKEPDARPRGWAPDLDDGVKVNIAPLDRAGVLRVPGVGA